MTQPKLRREITVLLVLKISIILLAGFTIFGAHNRVHVDTALMSRQLLDASAAPAADQKR